MADGPIKAINATCGNLESRRVAHAADYHADGQDQRRRLNPAPDERASTQT